MSARTTDATRKCTHSAHIGISTREDLFRDCGERTRNASPRCRFDYESLEIPRQKTDPNLALAEAHARLVQSNRPINARTLRQEAGASRDAARQWLKTNRPDQGAPTPPLEELRPAFDTLRAPAWTAARDECRSQHADALHAHEAGETDALEQSNRLTSDLEAHKRQATELQSEFSRVNEELQRARAAAAAEYRELAARTQKAEQSEAAERERAHTADRAAASAEATANTLKCLLDERVVKVAAS